MAYIIISHGNGLFTVQKKINDRVVDYWVDIWGNYCSCPNYHYSKNKKKHKCKHIIMCKGLR